MGTQDSKVALSIPVKEKKLMDAKLEVLQSWILRQDFTAKGIAKVFQRDYYWYYNKYVSVKKEGSLGFLWCWQLMCFFNYVIVTRNSSMSCYTSTTEVGPVWRHILDS